MSKSCVIALTKGGVQLARSVRKKMEMVPYFPEKFAGEGESSFSDFSAVMEEIFHSYDKILCIMATGIVIRSIAPYIKDKKTDPAVLVMDEGGNFVISLLSGHLGGANDWARELSEKMGATPVITTASDVTGKVAVDTFAVNHQLTIYDMKAAKVITALIVNGEEVALANEIDWRVTTSTSIKSEMTRNTRGVIYIGRKKREFLLPYSYLYPKDVVIGIGCRRGTDPIRLRGWIEEVLKEENIGVENIRRLASIDVKSEEKAILELAKEYKVPVQFYKKERLLEVEEFFEVSNFVKKTVGVGNVCETAGYLASNRGRQITKKRAKDGMTVALFLEESWQNYM